MANFNLQGTPLSTFHMYEFSGGLNTYTSPFLLKENEARDLLNISFRERGSISKREGVKILKDEEFNCPYKSSNYVGLYRFAPPNINETYLFHFYEDGTVYSYHNGTFKEVVFVNEDDTLFHSTGKTSGKKFSCFSFGLNFYLTNGTDGLFKFDPSFTLEAHSGKLIIKKIKIERTKIDSDGNIVYKYDASGNPVYLKDEKGNNVPVRDRDGNIIEGKYEIDVEKVETKFERAFVFHNRVFYCGDSLNKDMVYFSALANPVNFDLMTVSYLNGEMQISRDSGGGYIMVVSDETDIMGLTEFMNTLVIFKKDSIWGLTGYTPNVDYKLEKLNVATGCIAPDSIQTTNNFLYYLGIDGIYTLNSTDEKNIISMNISKKISSEVEKLQGKITATYSFGTYYLFGENFCLLFDEDFGAWTKYDVSARFSTYDHTTDQLIFIQDKSYLYVFDKNEKSDEYEPDVKQAITCFYSTGFTPFEEPHITKRYRFMKIFYRPNENVNSKTRVDINIDYKLSNKSFATFYNVFRWGEAWGENWGVLKDQVSNMIRFGGSGSYISITFFNNDLDADMVVRGITFGFKRKKKIR